MDMHLVDWMESHLVRNLVEKKGLLMVGLLEMNLDYSLAVMMAWRWDDWMDGLTVDQLADQMVVQMVSWME